MARKLSTKQSATAAVEQPLGRPLVAGAAEFLGRRGFDDPHALGGERHVAVGAHRGVD